MSGGRVSCAVDEVFPDDVAFGSGLGAEVLAVLPFEDTDAAFVAALEGAESFEDGAGVGGVGENLD